MPEHDAPDPIAVPPSDEPTVGMEPGAGAAGERPVGIAWGGDRRGKWQPPSAEELQLGLPQYEIRQMLGRGGMGVVYQGWQKSLDRLVAIKILNQQLENRTPGFAERFKREARAMARFAHPGIIAVHDAGETDGGLLYFVMEYVDGTDVQQMLAREGRFAPERAMEIAGHVCTALAYAHQRGVVHRDIKPANVMVDAEGGVKVADFGLVKIAAEEAAPLTRPMEAMGTPNYMAPETMLGLDRVDHRADLYAVGVMLYVMLTGQIPRGTFEAPSRWVAGLDPRLDAVVKQAMQRDPEQRYASAGDLRRDLESILGRTPSHAAAPAAEKPGRPDLGPLVAKMCDRTVEQEQFQRFFAQHAQEQPGVPQIIFARGWERERLDSLVARFCGTTLRRYAERVGGLYHGVLDQREILEWPVAGAVEDRHRTLLEELFDLYDWPGVPPGDAPAAREFLGLVKAQRYPVVVFQFHVHLARWDRTVLESLGRFLRFWDEIGHAPVKGTRPQLVLFLHLIYPELHALRRWLAWFFFRPRRVERELLRMLAARQRPSVPAACPALLLGELGPVERQDVIQWFRRHHLLGDSMKMWQTRCNEIFGDRLRLPMMEIEDALLALYEQHLERRSIP